MPTYRYKAVTVEGDTVSGTAEASSQNAVAKNLLDQGHTPLFAEEISKSPLRRSFQNLISGRGFSGRDQISLSELHTFTSKLAVLVNAELTIPQALSVMIPLVDSDAQKQGLRQVLARIIGGSTLADGLAQNPKAFPKYYLGMVRAGEVSGSLGATLSRLAEHLSKVNLVREQIVSALIYPAILLGVSALTVFMVLAVVLPRFRPLFEGSEGELPLTTQALFAISSVLTGNWWWAGLFLLLTASVGYYSMRNDQIRASVDRAFIRLPILWVIYLKSDTARLSRTLGMLIGGGVPLAMAVQIAQGTIANRVIAASVANVHMAMREGQSFVQALKIEAVFPGTFVELMSIGEESGKLETMLLEAAEILDREVKASVDRLVALLIPALTILTGIIVAGVVASIISAVLSVNDLVAT